MKNFRKILLIMSVSAFSFLFMANNIYSQIGSTGGLDGRFEGWFTNVLRWLITLAGIVAAAILVFNAFAYITASGEEAKIQKATKGITYAIIGLVLAALAFLIVNYVIDRV